MIRDNNKKYGDVTPSNIVRSYTSMTTGTVSLFVKGGSNNSFEDAISNIIWQNEDGVQQANLDHFKYLGCESQAVVSLTPPSQIQTIYQPKSISSMSDGCSVTRSEFYKGQVLIEFTTTNGISSDGTITFDLTFSNKIIADGGSYLLYLPTIYIIDTDGVVIPIDNISVYGIKSSDESSTTLLENLTITTVAKPYIIVLENDDYRTFRIVGHNLSDFSSNSVAIYGSFSLCRWRNDE